MSNPSDSNHPIKHLAGLVSATLLAVFCWWLWEKAEWLSQTLGAPEFRILIAMTLAFLVLSLAHYLTADE